MDEALLERLKGYLNENYEEPPLVLCQRSTGTAARDDDEKDSGASYDYYQLELNLPPLEETFAAGLLEVIRAKGKTEIEIYKKAHIDRRLFSKIRTRQDYTPSKETILALIIALELDIEEAKDLLARAGYCLSRSKKEDVVIRFFLENRIYDLFAIQGALDHFGLPLLGG